MQYSGVFVDSDDIRVGKFGLVLARGGKVRHVNTEFTVSLVKCMFGSIMSSSSNFACGFDQTDFVACFDCTCEMQLINHGLRVD